MAVATFRHRLQKNMGERQGMEGYLQFIGTAAQRLLLFDTADRLHYLGSLHFIPLKQNVSNTKLKRDKFIKKRCNTCTGLVNAIT